jgi:aryl-alcohol dehydrogenase-like predicted oxidoreductase
MTPPLVLGCSVFGWTVDRTRAFAILDRFVEAGGTMIDTADAYADGVSETIIGEWLRASGAPIKVATKVGMLAGRGGDGLKPSRILAACDESRDRLGVDAIDLYYAHRDDPAVPQPRVLEAFATLIDAGKVRAIGASTFTAPRLAAALDIAGREGLPAYSTVQARYNLLTRGDFEGPLQDLCIARGLPMHPHFALARGFLTGKYRTPADLEQSPRGIQMDTLMRGRPQALLNVMDEVAAETGATHAQLAIAWLVTRPGVTAPIASVTSVEQLDALLGYTRVRLNQDQIARLTSAGR